MFEGTRGYVKYSNTSLDIDEILQKIERIDQGRLREEDIFRNEDSTPKQIQHLEKVPEIREVGEWLKREYKIEGGEIINIQLFTKYPASKATKAHQDGAYFGNDGFVTFWIPLQDVDETNSCLYYVNDSFRRGLLEHEITGSHFRVRSGVPGYSMEYKAAENYTPINMKKGDILCHHPYTLHFSDVNRSDAPRKALTCIFKL